MRHNSWRVQSFLFLRRVTRGARVGTYQIMLLPQNSLKPPVMNDACPGYGLAPVVEADIHVGRGPNPIVSALFPGWT